MRCLIAGGTGFIGTALTQHLLQNQHQITILSRNKTKIKSQFGNSVGAVDWDEFESTPEKFLNDVDCVINLCGANIGDKRWTEKRKQELRSSRIEPTTTLAKAIASLEQAPRFLSANGIGIYGLQDPSRANLPAPLDENSPVDKEGRCFLSKLGNEWEAASHIARDAGKSVVNMRFGVALDKHGGALPKMALPFKLFVGGVVGSGHQPISWIMLHDLVRAIEFIMQNPDITGPVNLVATRCVKAQEFAHSLASQLRRPCVFPMPASVCRLMFGEMGEELLLSGQHVIPDVLVSRGFTFDAPDIDTALEVIYTQKTATTD